MPTRAEIEIEGRTYRVLAQPKRAARGEVVCDRKGRRYRNGARLCPKRSKQRFNALEFRRSLGDVPDELLEADPWEFRALAVDYDERHFALCEQPEIVRPRPRGACHYHGGKSLAGVSSPRAGDLSSSIYAPAGRLRISVEAMLAAAKADDLSHEIALHRAVVKETAVRALDSGEAVAVFDEVRRAVKAIETAITSGESSSLMAALESLRALDNGRGRALAAQELARHQQVLARLVSAQVARRKALDEVVTPLDLAAFESRVAGAMRRLVRRVSELLPARSPARKALPVALSEAQRDLAAAGPILEGDD